jgi:hypothetical protein
VVSQARSHALTPSDFLPSHTVVRREQIGFNTFTLFPQPLLHSASPLMLRMGGVSQAAAALANLCYDSDVNRDAVVAAGGVAALRTLCAAQPGSVAAAQVPNPHPHCVRRNRAL